MIRDLAGRVKQLNTEMADIDEMLTELITQTAPGLLDREPFSLLFVDKR